MVISFFILPIQTTLTIGKDVIDESISRNSVIPRETILSFYSACEVDRRVNDTDDFVSFEMTIENGVIHLRNPTDTAVSTKGLYLTNDDDLLKWQMPAVIIRAGQTVQIRTNGDSVTPVLKRMTANFNLRSGDTLRLADVCGNVLSEVEVTFTNSIVANRMPNFVFTSSVSESVRNSIVQYIEYMADGIDLGDFTFSVSGLGAWRERTFMVYYNETLLNPAKYSFVLRHTDGGFEVMVEGIWEHRLFEQTHMLCFEPSITQIEAFQISRAFSKNLPIPDIDLGWFSADNMGEFTTTEFLGSIDATLVIYCLDELIAAYRTEDFNEIIISDASVALVKLYVYVCIKTGEVLEHNFDVDISLI